jgi:hypothetical protein
MQLRQGKEDAHDSKMNFKSSFGCIAKLMQNSAFLIYFLLLAQILNQNLHGIIENFRNKNRCNICYILRSEGILQF